MLPAAPGLQRWPPDMLTLAGLGAGLSGSGSFVPVSPTRSTGRFTAAEAPPTSAPASPTRLDGKEFFRTARWVWAAGSQQLIGCSGARLWCTMLGQAHWSKGGHLQRSKHNVAAIDRHEEELCKASGWTGSKRQATVSTRRWDLVLCH